VPAAEEAWIAPARFRLDTPAHRGLRRKLRAAEAAGVTVVRGGATLPIDEMAEVAAAWAIAHGGERGFSIGRFAPDYVAGQRVYLARHGDRLVAFLTFHDGAREWTLDLVRALPDAPDGAAYALLAGAIGDAATRATGSAGSSPPSTRHGRRSMPPPRGACRSRSGSGTCSGASIARGRCPRPMQAAQEGYDEYRVAAGEGRGIRARLKLCRRGAP
jgi:hypothetical protein